MSSKIQVASQDTLSKEYDEYEWPRFRPIVRSTSCPDVTYREMETSIVKRRPLHGDWLKARSATNFSERQTKGRKLCQCAANTTAPKTAFKSPNTVESNMFKNLAATGCPCPCPSPCGPCCPPSCCCGPCGGGCQLPPPCNTPPKCIQHMTGYYYYPYGTWFCGPYHTSTGCTPCCGPMSPGGPCGPCTTVPPKCCCRPGCCCGVLGCSLGQNISFGSPECFPKGVHATDFPQPQESAKVPPAVLFGLPYDGIQTPTPCGTGYNVNFPPIALATNTGHDFSQSKDGSRSTNPRWLSQHTPCECSDCQMKRKENASQAAKQAELDLKSMYNILGPFSKAFPSKKSENVAQTKKSSESKLECKKASDILKNPKVKATFP